MPKGTRKPRKRRPLKKKEEPEETPSEDDENDLVNSGEENVPSDEGSGGDSGEDSAEGSDEDSAEGSDEEEAEPPKPKPASKKPASKKPASKKVTKKPVSKKVTEPQEPGRRYFKILTGSIKPEKSPKVDPASLSSGGGRYTGNNPMQAAKKAFTRISRAACKDGECTYIFSIQETTQGSAKKIFQYRGVREELDEPTMIKKGDTEYPIKFKSAVRSYKEGAPPRKTASKKKTNRRKK